jgi:hypothetical protein
MLAHLIRTKQFAGSFQLNEVYAPVKHTEAIRYTLVAGAYELALQAAGFAHAADEILFNLAFSHVLPPLR